MVSMSTGRCVRPEPYLSALSGTARLAALTFLVLCGLKSTILFSPLPALADETIIAAIIVNTEDKGAFFVVRTDEDDFLVNSSDLSDAGLDLLKGKVVSFEGSDYLSLKSVEGAEFSFNEAELSIEVVMDPSLLGRKTVVDFSATKVSGVYRPRYNSAFLNYSLNYISEDYYDTETFVLNNELGIRYGDLLFLTNSTYRDTGEESDFLRLMSNVTYDRSNDLTRLVVGDILASSGDFGTRVNMGGVSFSKHFPMESGFIKHPSLDIKGFATFPSELEVYLDGVRIKNERVRPGEFVLSNIYQIAGARLIEVVVRDPFGNETRHAYPFYFTNKALSKGLHEYSYNLGFLREDFGTTSNNYGDYALSAIHRYGWTNSLTVGFGAEATEDFYALSPAAVYASPGYGVFSLALSGTNYDGDTGFAGSFSFNRVKKYVGGGIFLEGFSDDYATMASAGAGMSTEYVAGARLSYGMGKRGNVSVGATFTGRRDAEDRREVTLGFTRWLSKKISMNISVRNIEEVDTDNEFFVRFNYYPSATPAFASLSHRSTEALDTTDLFLFKGPPPGEGFGYKLSMRREKTDTYTRDIIDPFVQYNSRYASLKAEYIYETNGRTVNTYRLTASGAVASVGGITGLTRPVTDSFALVKVGELEGVPVMVNNQVITKSRKDGFALLPTLGSYSSNQVSIVDDDIPMDYDISGSLFVVSPLPRSGVCLDMSVSEFRALSGRLMVVADNAEVKPVEFYEAQLKVDGLAVTFPTGTGGEFYIDMKDLKAIAAKPDGRGASDEEKVCPIKKNGDGAYSPDEVLGSGTYKAEFKYNDILCRAELVVPVSDSPVVDLGTVVCKVVPVSDESVISATETGGTAIVSAAEEPPVEEPPVEESPAQALLSTSEDVGTEDAGEALAPDTGVLAAPVVAMAPVILPSIDVADGPRQEEELKETQGEAPVAPETLEVTEIEPYGATPSSGKDELCTTDPPLSGDGEFYLRSTQVDSSTVVRGVHFPFDRATLEDEFVPVLNELADLLKADPEKKVLIEGHADERGSEIYNIRLGMKRARFIESFLIEKGVLAERFSDVTSFGESRHLCDCGTRQCHRNNRRAEIVVSSR